MRLFVSVIATTAMFFAASVAGAAATFTATASSSGGPISALNPGDVVTIDITLGSDGSAVFGLGVSAVGYNPAIASFTSGSVPANVLNAICVAPGTCFGGLANTTGSAAESTANVPNLPEIQLFNGVSTVAVNGTGSADQGVITLVAGDPQFQIVFTAGSTFGSTTISIGANDAYGDQVIGTGGAVEAATNAAVTLTVIPEPGTALLMGLGLAGLASAGRRN